MTSAATVRTKVTGADPTAAARSISAFELLPSLGRFLPAGWELEKEFGRTSLILALWPPWPSSLGGAPSAHLWLLLHAEPKTPEIRSCS